MRKSIFGKIIFQLPCPEQHCSVHDVSQATCLSCLWFPKKRTHYRASLKAVRVIQCLFNIWNFCSYSGYYASEARHCILKKKKLLYYFFFFLIYSKCREQLWFTRTFSKRMIHTNNTSNYLQKHYFLPENVVPIKNCWQWCLCRVIVIQIMERDFT